ncbi:uncharacterized protein JCM6883_004345 [Sporobolomyces salmoneus]|uniref:uncharacterized protein n=1 Tax=Sporobolomyces salmoneus TaxID=183962 RepID=UPI00317662B0
MAAALPSIKMPAQNQLQPMPRSFNTVFEFVFSQPFVKGSKTWEESPKELQKRTLERIPADRPSFRDGKTGAILSYGRLYSDSLSIAQSLTENLRLSPAPASISNPSINRGAIVSPVILLNLPNCLPFATLAYGTLASGLTLTAANPVLTPPELAHILTLSQPSCIVTTPAGITNLQAAFKLLPADLQSKLAYPTKGNVFVVDPESDDYGASSGSLRPSSQTVGGWKVQDWKVLLPNRPSKSTFVPPKYSGDEDAKRAAMIFWSSGTSGKSKGVILSHRALGMAQIGVWHASTLGADERLVGLPPFYHIFGWANILLPAVSIGATVTCISKFDPVSYLTIAQEIRATHLHFSPPVAVLFAKSPMVDGFDLSSVRGCTSGGAPLATSVIEEVYKRLKILIKVGYGLSETGGVTQQQSMTWPDLKAEMGSCGSAYPGTEIKIRSIEDGKTVNVEEEGEILVRSECCTISYLYNDPATIESFDQDGWFCTGDVGKLNARGVLTITDRLKNLIKVKGFQVAPSELEDSLCASPLVSDAGVSSIYHDDHATEYPRAYVVPFDKECLVPGPKATEFAHKLRAHIEGKHAPYKWIRGGFVIIEQVPKSPAGKILRRLLNDTKGHHVQVYEEKIRAKL